MDLVYSVNYHSTVDGRDYHLITAYGQEYLMWVEEGSAVPTYFVERFVLGMWAAASRFKAHRYVLSDMEAVIIDEFRAMKLAGLEQIEQLNTEEEFIACASDGAVPLVDPVEMLDIYISALSLRGFFTPATYEAFRAWVLDVGIEIVREL